MVTVKIAMKPTNQHSIFNDIVILVIFYDSYCFVLTKENFIEV